MRLPLDSDTPLGRLVAFVSWATLGALGTGLLFAAATRLPEEWRRPVLTAVVLGAACGWGMGLWGFRQGIRATVPAILAALLIIAAGEVTMTVKIHRRGVEQMRAQAQWQEAAGDPVTEKLREFLAHEPEDESPEDRAKRLDLQASLEQGEAKRRERLAYFSFSGYLAHRIPPAWGKWNSPWPALFWIGEVLLASCVGAWLTRLNLRQNSGPSTDWVESLPA